MQFGVLGPLEVLDDRYPIRIGSKKLRALLAILLLNANQTVSRGRLVEELWGDEPPATSTKTLQVFVNRLRHTLEPSLECGTDSRVILTRSPGYAVHVEPGQLDLASFEKLLAQGETALKRGDPGVASEKLHDALALWRGSPLADLADQPFAMLEIGRLEKLRLRALEQRIEADIALGRDEEVIPELETLVAEFPLREHLHIQHILALYRSGRQAEALTAHRNARELLSDQHGIRPTDELQRLERAILEHDPELASPAVSSSESDRRVKDYEMHDLIGEGGFGAVRRAHQPSLGREVAIKVIRQSLALDPIFIKRFEEEANLVARLEHPRIVPLYDYWRDADGAYLVMRFLRGGSLRTNMRGPTEPGRVACLFEHVADALVGAHREGVVHGNVKPSNILLDEEGNAYLSDFGIAADVLARRLLDDPEQEQEQLLHCAPEQLRGERASPQTDVYGLGLVLHELLTGSSPCSRDTEHAEHAGTELLLPSLGGDRSTVLPAVADVVRQATAERQTDRFGDVAEFVAAFRGARATTSTAAIVSSGPEASNPDRGHSPFGEADAAGFFGRDELVGELVERLSDPTQRFVALVGGGASGKSSVVRAGLIPQVRRGCVPGSERWVIAQMRPGSDPLEELEAALLRVAVNPPASLLEQLQADEHGLHRAVKRALAGDDAELLLVIDQFEEMFANADDEQAQRHFLRSLQVAVDAPNAQLRLIIVLNTTFLEHALRDRAFARLIRDGLVLALPLSDTELEQAIVAPAQLADTTVEPELVSDLIQTLGGITNSLER